MAPLLSHDLRHSQVANTVMSLKQAVAFIVLLLLAQLTLAAPAIAFNPASRSASIGETFTLVLRGTGFGLTAGGQIIDNVSGGQNISVQFPPGVLEVLSVSIDPRWSFAAGNSTGTINNPSGTVTGIGFAAFPATLDDTFDIGTVSFRVLAAGNANIGVGAGTVVGRVAGVSGTPISMDFPQANVQVPPPFAKRVPVSPWVPLILGCLFVWRCADRGPVRRRR